MGLHSYCIVPSGTPREADLRGIEGVAVGSVAAGPVEVWCSELARRPRATLSSVRAHDAVIRTVLEGGVTPLPVRFGQWLPGPEALRARVEDSAAAYRDALEELAGCVEFGVRFEGIASKSDAASPPPPPAEGDPDGSGAGRAYLRELGRRRRAAESVLGQVQALAAELELMLGDAVRRSVVTPAGRAEGELAGAAHLVARAAADRYRAGVDRFGRERPDLRLRVTGPWPPYSFAP